MLQSHKLNHKKASEKHPCGKGTIFVEGLQTASLSPSTTALPGSIFTLSFLSGVKR